MTSSKVFFSLSIVTPAVSSIVPPQRWLLVQPNQELTLAFGVCPRESLGLLGIAYIYFGSAGVARLLEDKSVVLTAVLNLHVAELRYFFFDDDEHLMQVLSSVDSHKASFSPAHWFQEGLKFLLGLRGEKERALSLCLLLLFVQEMLFFDLSGNQRQ